MPEPQPIPQLRAVDVTSGHGVVAAKILDGPVEAHRAAVILVTVGNAIDEYRGTLRFVVLDHGEVDFINSSGVAALLELAGVVKQKGAQPIVYRPTPNVAKILKLVRADRLYTFVPTADELAKVLGD
ncbi:MAG: STAS domain-containing protein [Planctomycetota bacterium]